MVPLLFLKVLRTFFTISLLRYILFLSPLPPQTCGSRFFFSYLRKGLCRLKVAAWQQNVFAKSYRDYKLVVEHSEIYRHHGHTILVPRPFLIGMVRSTVPMLHRSVDEVRLYEELFAGVYAEKYISQTPKVRKSCKK